MKKGTIVLIRFPFTDFTSEKRRPALVISAHSEKKSDVIVAFISSIVPTKLLDTDFILNEKDPKFSETHLHKTSVVRFDKIMTIEKELISGEIGNIPSEQEIQIDGKLKIVFGL